MLKNSITINVEVHIIKNLISITINLYQGIFYFCFYNHTTLQSWKACISRKRVGIYIYITPDSNGITARDYTIIGRMNDNC